MYDGLGKRPEKNETVHEIMRGASQKVLNVCYSVKLDQPDIFPKVFQKMKWSKKILNILNSVDLKRDETLAEEFLAYIVKFDTAAEEIISRSYYESYCNNSSSEKGYYDSMEDMGFQSEEIYAIKRLRKVRNMFCHSFKLASTLKFVFQDASKKDLFLKSMMCTQGVIKREYAKLSQDTSTKQVIM